MCADQWIAGKVKACQTGQDPAGGDCSSMLDFMKAGCSSTDLFGTVSWVMHPLGDPDADTDGDGTPDSYTMVAHIATQRVKIGGYTDEEPFGKPIPPEE